MKRFIVPFIIIAEIAVAAAATQAQAQDGGVVADQDAGSPAAADWRAVETSAAKAYGQSPSPMNEFNLAVAYAHTGKTVLAIPLFVDVAANGKDAEATALYRYRRGGPSVPVKFNVADEANRRLAALVGEPIGDSSGDAPATPAPTR